MCEQLAKIVLDAEFKEDQGVFIAFEDGSSVHLSSRPEDYRGPEAIMFQVQDKSGRRVI
jgi:hypothetical protein